MRKLLFWVLFLYDVFSSRPDNYAYDYIPLEQKHQHMADMQRNWKRNNGQPRNWDDYVHAGRERPLETDRRYEASYPTSQQGAAAAHPEMRHMEKEPDRRALALTCDRPREKYEACFAGCASVSCDNPRERLRPCYPFCEAGCVCMPPYVRDDRTHKCIMPEECSKGLKGIPDIGEEK